MKECNLQERICLFELTVVVETTIPSLFAILHETTKRTTKAQDGLGGWFGTKATSSR